VAVRAARVKVVSNVILMGGGCWIAKIVIIICILVSVGGKKTKTKVFATLTGGGTAEMA
jgi:hypothetical protein